MKVFALAQKLWQLNSRACRELENLALQIEPEFTHKLRSIWPIYGFFYRVFGFEVAQRYGLVSRAAKNVCSAVWPMRRQRRRAAG